MLKGLVQRITKVTPPFSKNKPPAIIPRAQHRLSRKDIHPNALKVLYRLHHAGYSALLVGGCVRDLLLGRHPKDFDIATNAKPEEIRQLFKNCRLIGRRFRLAHILFGRNIIEVATFRASHETDPLAKGGHMRDGIIIRDNVYGTLDDDVWRRDFTINALYYNIADFSIIDYTDALKDIQNKELRMIGDPQTRFLEDPVRLIRAIRFMGKLKLNIASETEAPISGMRHLLDQVSPARLFQEIIKIFQDGNITETFQLLERYHLLEHLFKPTLKYLHEIETQKLLKIAFMDADNRYKENKKVSTSFLLTTILWRPIAHQMKIYEANEPRRVALEKAIRKIFQEQVQQLTLTRNLQIAIRDIALLQETLTLNKGRKMLRVLEHPRFRAAFDLLTLRQKSGEDLVEHVEWWTVFQAANEEKRLQLIHEKSPRDRRRRNRRRGSRTGGRRKDDIKGN